jgi:hypothetical protein
VLAATAGPDTDPNEIIPGQRVTRSSRKDGRRQQRRALAFAQQEATSAGAPDYRFARPDVVERTSATAT